MRLAISYDRFSSGQQRLGTSAERQTSATEDACARKGWQLDDRYAISDHGRSGFHGEQRALKQFAADCEAGLIPKGAVLCVEKMDRVSREGIDPAYQLVRQILKAGIDIYEVAEDRLLTAADLNEPMRVMEFVFKAYLAWQESEKKQYRAKSNWRIAREKGICNNGRLPAWIVRRDGKYDLDQPKAEIVRKIFEWSAEGVGDRQIVKKLVEAHIPSIADGFSKKASKTWNLTYIRALLANRATFGECQQYVMEGRKRVPLGEPIPNYYPAAIDEDLFYRVQAAKATRRKQRGPIGVNVANLFASICFDARTGSKMRMAGASNQDRARGLTRRIVSTAGYDGHGKFISWSYQDFESMLLETICKVSDVPKPLSIDPIPGLQEKLRHIEDQIIEVQNDIAEGAKNYRSLKGLLKRLDVEAEAVKVAIADAENLGGDAVDTCRTIHEMLTKTPPEKLGAVRERLRRSIRSAVKEIWVLIEEVGGNRLLKKMTCWVSMVSGDEHVFQATRWKGIVSEGMPIVEIASHWAGVRRQPKGLINWAGECIDDLFDLKNWRVRTAIA